MPYEDLSGRAAASFGGFNPFFAAGGLGAGGGSLSNRERNALEPG